MNKRSIFPLLLGTTLIAACQPITGPDPLPVNPPDNLDLSWQELFDDFAYQNAQDSRLQANGWSISARNCCPGAGGFRANLVSFAQQDGRSIMRLDLESSGSRATSNQSEIITSQQKFFAGTYAARVRFSDQPLVGTRLPGDFPVQTFYSITPYYGDMHPDYSELDFEYLPNGGWGTPSGQPKMWLSSWDTYQADPWVQSNKSDALTSSFDDWKLLLIQVEPASQPDQQPWVRYYIDGQLVANHTGVYFPVTPMFLSFNHWWISTNESTDYRLWRQEVDWVYYADDQLLSTVEVMQRVEGLRRAGIEFRDTVPAKPLPSH